MELKLNTLERLQTKLVVTKAKNLPHGQFEAVLSTDDLDRHGEHVSIKGLDVPKNQTIKMYYNHQTYGDALPIGKWNKVWKSADGKLMGQGEIDLEDDFAVKIYKKILAGYIDSISIGFYPTEFDGDSTTWTKSTLVEASVVAEPANVNAVITQKTLGFTEADFKESLKVKLAQVQEKTVLFIPKRLSPEVMKSFTELLTKGGVADVLSQQDKWEQMEDFWEVVYAFSDAYYSPDSKVTDFPALLTECIQILQTIADGNYQYEDEEDDTEDDTQDSSDVSSAMNMPEIKTAIDSLKSSVGALEAAQEAANENPATKTLITVRLAAKAVDKAAEEVNRTVKVKLKESN